MRWRSRAYAILFVAPYLTLNGGDDISNRESAEQALTEALAQAAAVRRPTHARFSMVPYAPVLTKSSETDAATLRLKSILAATGKVKLDPQLRAAALVYAGRAADAVQLLETGSPRYRGGRPIFRDRRDSLVHDLTAALIAKAEEEKDPHVLIHALASAITRLDADPRSTQAQFNLGMVWSLLGARRQARDVWDRYLRLDDQSSWRQEGVSWRNRMSIPFVLEEWESVEERLRTAAIRNDRTELKKIVTLFAQESRTAVEWTYLTRWGRAVLADDMATAERELLIAERIATAIRARTGESLGFESVHAIRRVADKRPLAEAQVMLADGQSELWQKRPACAVFQKAAARFRAAGSAMAFLAEYAAANDCTKGKERQAAIAELERKTPEPYRALRARLQSIMASVWGPTVSLEQRVRSLEKVATLYASLGEDENEAWVLTERADVLIVAGHPGDTWQTLAQALGKTRSEATFAQVRQKLHLAEAGARHSDVAMAFMGLSEPEEDPPFSQLQLAVDDVNSIAGWRPLSTVEKQTLRETLRSRSSAEQMERETLNALTSPLTYGTGERRSAALAEVLHSRGELLRTTNQSEILAFVQNRVARVERTRGQYTDEYVRASILSTSREYAYENLSDLLLLLDDVAGALETTERVRGRTFLDRHYPEVAANGLRASELVARMPPDMAILEYVALRSRVVGFVITQEGITVRNIPLTEGELRAAVERQNFSTLYDLLFRLLEKDVAGRDLVVVADDDFASVPFALLHDGSRYLFEKHSIVYSPSATLYVLGAATQPSPRPRRLLVASDTQPDREAYPVERLPKAELEAKTLAGMYPSTQHLNGVQARAEVVARGLANADVLHLPTHALAKPRDPCLSGLLLSKSATACGLWSPREIAKTSVPRHLLVVLAGCSTAAVVDTHSDVKSLALAFIAAGARNVVGTQWDVEDSATADFSILFHRGIVAGLSPRGALREAQLEMLRSGRYSVRDWGAFQLIGSD